MSGGKAQETARGEAIQEADLLGDNAEDVDADLQRESLCLVHKPNHDLHYRERPCRRRTEKVRQCQ